VACRARRRSAAPEPVPGAEALHLWAPNFTELEWKDIITLHDHDAIGEFRQKLVEAESTVAGLADPERQIALKDIGYQAALDSRRSETTKWLDFGIDLAAGAVVDLVPYGGSRLLRGHWRCQAPQGQDRMDGDPAGP
jgi:hypothetical protein